MRYLKRGSRGNRRGRGRGVHEDEDPLSAVANLFDVAMIFALGLMVMVLMQMGMQEALINPEKMKEIIERGEMMEMSAELVTISADPTNVESGTMYTFGEEEEETVLWVSESVEGQGQS